jgi:hypothetical protein
MRKTRRSCSAATRAGRVDSVWPGEDRHLPRGGTSIQSGRWIGRSAGDDMSAAPPQFNIEQGTGRSTLQLCAQRPEMLGERGDIEIVMSLDVRA